MTLSEYRSLVERAEALAARDSGAYRRRVAWLAALGIGYVLAALVLALGSAAAGVALIVFSKNVLLIKLALAPLALAGVLGRALWVRLQPPQGERVRTTDAPALFAEIEHVRRKLAARPIHAVVLTQAFNASITQVPRLGIFGWPRNWLALGVPLLASLTPEQFRAVLAHELGHLARNHARFGNWIYRIRRTWSTLVAALEAKQSAATRLFARFLDWYAPYFNAWTFALARANEYEADRESARVAGSDHVAAALTAVYVRGDHLDRCFWPQFYRAAGSEAEPPARPFSQLLAELGAFSQTASGAAIEGALARRTTLDDTHPSLADRLAALGQSAAPLAPVERSAADVLLGPLRPRFVDDTDVSWRSELAETWHARHQEGIETRARLDELSALAEDALTDEQRLEQALLVESNDGAAAAQALLDRMLVRNPDHVGATYHRGRLRLNDGDVAAERPGAELLYRFWYQRNRIELAQRHLDTLERYAARDEAARLERSFAVPKDTFEPHGLEPAQLEPWQRAIATAGFVRRAWLARKKVEHFPEHPCFVLVVQKRRFARMPQASLQALADALPEGAAHLILHGPHHRRVWRRIRAFADAEVPIPPRPPRSSPANDP